METGLIKNNSLIHALPILFENDVGFKYLKGVFIGDEDRVDLTNNIFLLFQFEYTNTYYQTYSKILKGHKYFKEEYCPDDYTIMFVYNVPEEYQMDFNIFRRSKYSKLSDRLKSRIIKFYGLDPSNYAHKVLYRDKELKEELENKLNVILKEDEEVKSILDLDIEFYSDKYKRFKGILNKLKDKDE